MAPAASALIGFVGHGRGKKTGLGDSVFALIVVVVVVEDKSVVAVVMRCKFSFSLIMLPIIVSEVLSADLRMCTSFIIIKLLSASLRWPGKLS